ncbi:hypothetical protein MMC25_000326 [Agyrium rufum]|nr:hypothetical protein [Agyrium rufum]
MNHLADFGASEGIEVPYVCSEMYDGEDFYSYPQRKGWDIASLSNGDLKGKSPDDAASFLQAWMYFGLLSYVLRPTVKSFDPKDFIQQTASGCRVVTTKKLGRYIVECQINAAVKMALLSNDGALEVSNYIAISHVWRDGLGNPAQNALHVCQLRTLQTFANQLLETEEESVQAVWWRDTLCIPVGDEYEEQRRSSIRNMRKIYESATKVLALDSGLMKVFKNSAIEELYLRLKLCGWMRRLWTLQGGVLAQDVYVQFSDGTKTLRELDNAAEEETLRDARGLFTRYSFLSKTCFGPFTRGQSASHENRLAGL